MNNEHEHLAPLAGLRLSEDEKSRMRTQLRAHIATHVPRPSAFAFFVRHGLATSLAAFLLLAGASTVLAHRSLPGDLFYPMKLAVNDRFAVVVAGDEEAKLDLELAQIDRSINDEERVASKFLDDTEREDDDEEELEDKHEDNRSGRTSDDADRGREDDEDEDEDDDRDERRDDEDRVRGNDPWLSDIDAELRALERDLKGIEEDGVPEE